MNIDAERLWRSISTLAEVGAYTDEATGLVGVNRLALTDADRDGRKLVKQWFEEAGLDVRVDRIGNVIARRAGREDLAPVMSGSHIDSVPTGGAFDGALGVLGALEVVRTLNDRDVKTRRPIEIAFFTDEEGARFGTDMLGSATAVGRLALDDALALSDRDGCTVGGELQRIGFAGDAPERLAPPHAYVEVHIEQGPILAANERDLGAVTGVQAISWQEVTIVGKSAHAGTTPMSLRHDAGLAAARIHLQLMEMIHSGKYGADMRATMGQIDVHPNRINIVPSRVVCTVDLRNPYDDLMSKAERDLADFFTHLADELGVEITARQTARTASVDFDPRVVELVERHMKAAGFDHERILSGAGHDAQELAALCPTAMIFVPGLYDGISHNPRELSTKEACAKGVSILYEALVELAEES
ncbi:MAG: Zn-dependent hydrolase [Deltaproteobacteria bacterium]|jgi:N-carbamoyl-L-amino-acid hydrolase